MPEITVTGMRHNADGSVSLIPITIDPDKAPKRVRPVPPIAGLVFLRRITDPEYAAIVVAAQTQLAAGQPQLSRWIDELRVNGMVNLSDPDATAAKVALVQAGLLTQPRADAIFAPDPI